MNTPSININYEGKKSQYDLILNPVPYLYVNAYLESTSDPIAYLNLFINDEFAGKTSSRGFSKIKVEYNKNYNVIGKKENTIPKSGEDLGYTDYEVINGLLSDIGLIVILKKIIFSINYRGVK